MAAHGEPQLEPQQQEVQVPVAPDAISIPAPAFAPEGGIATGARAAEGPAGLRAVLGAASPGHRRKFVLQLQRTAGNAAVCRWLGVGRGAGARAATADAPGASGEDWSDVEALLAATGDEPPETGGPRAR
jgi:hypothetical protein